LSSTSDPTATVSPGVTTSTAPGPDPEAAATIIARGDVVAFRLSHDGTAFTVWATGIGQFDECRLAFRLRRLDGRESTGRLGHASCYSTAIVHSARSGFLIIANRPRLVTLDGELHELERVDAGAFVDGDFASTDEPGRRLIVYSPGRGAVLRVDNPERVIEAVAAGRTLWGVATETAPNGDSEAAVAWTEDGEHWSRRTFDSAGRDDWAFCCYHVEVVATGPHTAAWVCGDMASSGVCGHVLTVTADRGATWHDLGFGDRPFHAFQSALSAGDTLFVQAGARIWRTTDSTWLHFEPVEGLPRRVWLAPQDGFLTAEVDRGHHRRQDFYRIDPDGSVSPIPSPAD
jgi:hypothetical protein